MNIKELLNIMDKINKFHSILVQFDVFKDILKFSSIENQTFLQQDEKDLVSVPLNFLDEFDYLKVFSPLFLLECQSQILRAWE